MFAACSKEPQRGSKEAVVNITAGIEAQTPSTKHGAPIMGTALPYTFTYGIFVCKHGTTDKANAHKTNSYNLAAQYTRTDDTWRYYYVTNLSTGAVDVASRDRVTITAREDAATADLYAYAPYTQSAYNSGPTSIPCTISHSFTDTVEPEYDVLYAVENTGSANKNLDPESESALSAHFTFRHAMCLLKFKFRVKNGVSDFKLQSITANIAPGATTAKLYSYRTFNAVTGLFNDGGSTTTSYAQANNYTLRHNYIDCGYYLMMPTEIADDELYFTFRCNNMTLQPLYIKREYVKHSDDTYGFQSGYMYTFNLVLDNYLYLDGITITDGWTDASLGEEHI